MELLELMRTRHSIRSYGDAPVSEEDITKILQAGMLSASGKAIRPWEFIVVTDKGCPAENVRLPGRICEDAQRSSLRYRGSRQ